MIRQEQVHQLSSIANDRCNAGVPGPVWAISRENRPIEQRAELHLPAEDIAPALARAGLRASMADVPERSQANIALLVSELVTNALRHGTASPGDEIVVRLSSNQFIRVEVIDPSPVFPPIQPASRPMEGLGGWGLYLVDSIADAWGVERDGIGKKVWFELDPGA